MKEVTIRELIHMSKDVYDKNIEYVFKQLKKNYYKNTNTCWSPMGFIGVEADGVMHKGKTPNDLFLDFKVKIKE